MRIARGDKELVWLAESLKSPPLSNEARVEAGFLLRRLQQGDLIGMPHSRPMPSIGKRCHEMRIQDRNVTWRIIYRIDDDAVILVVWFDKKAQKTPNSIIEKCRRRLAGYDAICSEEE